MKPLEDFIYTLLLEEPRTGYQIAKEIEQRTGWKPSWGSIYPKLESMQECGILSVKEKGRSKIYSLTKKGHEFAKERVERTTELLKEILERMRIIQTLTQQDLTVVTRTLEMLIGGESPFFPIDKEAQRLREQFIRLLDEGKIRTHQKKINAALKKCTKELKTL